MKKWIWNKHTKSVIKQIVGWLCIALGILMLITPGQGIITLLIGVFLLADHIPLFGKIKTNLQTRFPKTTDYVQSKIEQLHQRQQRR